MTVFGAGLPISLQFSEILCRRFANLESCIGSHEIDNEMDACIVSFYPRHRSPREINAPRRVCRFKKVGGCGLMEKESSFVFGEMKNERKVPSLLELCTQMAIDNLRYLGDVGELDLYLLKDILPHCTIDQLMHIEESTEGRDLSPVTDRLWKRFYVQQFGEENTNLVIKRMKQKQVVFKWRQLFEAKTKEREEAQQRLSEKLKQRYAEEHAKKQSRQIKICAKVPPSSCKRFFGGSGSGYDVSNLKGNLMKKAKLEFLNSHEAKVHSIIRKNTLQNKTIPPPSIPRSAKPGNFFGKGSATSSKLSKPPGRR
ncbi:hypothetical protein J5N97_022385 [Dioscorea zingiberensis]|uniref:Elongin-A n=1 Tax=Dioscorea zingiberensis TaxID=325984 RepID=A0A9D5CAA3_9LILI|nr:hypothetical protein J5N97_022385 [Dioscorea zingiberensis]